MSSNKCFSILFSALIGIALFGCKAEGEILTKKNMQFVGQFNKGFSYEILGFGPLLQKITFSQDDIIALAQEQIPEAATLEDIYVVDVGFRINPNEDHAADYIDIQITEDTSEVPYVFSIEDLFVDGMLIIDPALLNLGDDYETMLLELNQLIQSGGIDDYLLELFFDPQDDDAMTDLDVDIIFSFKFSFRACVDVPVGTTAEDCE